MPPLGDLIKISLVCMCVCARASYLCKGLTHEEHGGCGDVMMEVRGGEQLRDELQ